MDSHYQRKNKKINIKTTSIYTWKKCHVEEKKPFDLNCKAVSNFHNVTNSGTSQCPISLLCVTVFHLISLNFPFPCSLHVSLPICSISRSAISAVDPGAAHFFLSLCCWIPDQLNVVIICFVVPTSTLHFSSSFCSATGESGS